MATKPIDGLLGSKDKYKVNAEAKRYTLKDHGFIENKNGSYVYERTLSRVITDSVAPKLKITISKNLSELKIVTVSNNGLKKVDIHRDKNHEQARMMVDVILQTFIEENVLEKA